MARSVAAAPARPRCGNPQLDYPQPPYAALHLLAEHLAQIEFLTSAGKILAPPKYYLCQRKVNPNILINFAS